MKILVTGGAGFLGFHLCEKLLKMGHYVVALDDLTSGDDDNVKKLKRYKNFSFINHDINNRFEIVIDGIFNLASAASPLFYQIDPIRTRLQIP